MSITDSGSRRSKKNGSISPASDEEASTNTSGFSTAERMRLMASRAPRDRLAMMNPPRSSPADSTMCDIHRSKSSSMSTPAPSKALRAALSFGWRSACAMTHSTGIP